MEINTMNYIQTELNLEEEIWKPHYDSNFPLYLVSSQGRIKNKNTNRILKQSLTNYKIRNKNGTRRALVQYYQIVLRDINNKNTNFRVHRLVLSTFKGLPPNPNMQCSHINGNPLDNNINNLEWTTPIQNNRMKIIHGTNHGMKGETNGFAKLKNEEVIHIKFLLSKNLKLKEIASKFNIHFSTVSLIKLGKKWKDVYLTDNDILNLKKVYNFQ